MLPVWVVAIGLLQGILAGTAGLPAADTQAVSRTEFFVESDPGVRIFVREIRVRGARGRSVLLIHGARVPGLESFDLPVPGGSLAEDLARRGLVIYVMDVRGYGRSTRSPEFSQPAENHPPLVRAPEALRDIDAVVRAVRRRNGGNKPALFGWAVGGSWAGYYASLHSDQLSHLVMLNALFGADAPQPMVGRGSDLEDPQRPGSFNPAVGAYRCNAASSLLGAWEKSIPMQDKDEWRDPAVAKAYVHAALGSDPQSKQHDPPCFRSPNGAMEDSFYQAVGRQLWDASLVTVPTLVIAGERDFWSRPQDREKLKQELVRSPRAEVLVLPNATHFVFLDRPEHGRQLLIDSVVAFLGAGQ